MRNEVLFLVLIGSASVAVGCKRLETGAREEFAAKHSCPEDSVTVKARSDLSWDGLNPAVVEEPSDEVKRDPARLAKWKEDQEANQAERRANNSKVEVFEATGCGHTEILGCMRSSSTGSAGRTTNGVSCFVHAKPGG